MGENPIFGLTNRLRIVRRANSEGKGGAVFLGENGNRLKHFFGHVLFIILVVIMGNQYPAVRLEILHR